MKIHKKMAHGALWSMVESLGNQGISFVVFMFVARLIGPREYGLANLCFVSFTFVNLVLMGLADGIVSLRVSDDRRLSTLFWCITAIGVALMIVGIGGAGLAARFMDEPRLQPMLQWFSLSFIFMALAAVPNKIIFAALDFKIFALRTLISSTLSGVVGIAMAWQGFGAYAIIGQQIILQATMCLIAWRYVEWRPALIFERGLLKEILSPGLKSISTGLVSFTDEQFPRLLIGSQLGPLQLGFYAFAMRIRYALQGVLIDPSLSVLYPSMAQIKEDHDEQKRVLGQIIELIGFLVYPVLALAVYLAPVYVPLLFGAAWIEAVPVLQLFICGSVVYPLLAIVRETLRAHNRIGSFVKIQVPVMLLSFATILVLKSYGIAAVSASIVGVALCALPVYLYFFKCFVGIDIWGAVLRLARPLSSVAFMIGVLALYAHAPFYPDNRWSDLLSSLALAGLAYFAACFIGQRAEMLKMLGFLRQMRGGSTVNPADKG